MVQYHDYCQSWNTLSICSKLWRYTLLDVRLCLSRYALLIQLLWNLEYSCNTKTNAFHTWSWKRHHCYTTNDTVASPEYTGLNKLPKRAKRFEGRIWIWVRKSTCHMHRMGSVQIGKIAHQSGVYNYPACLFIFLITNCVRISFPPVPHSDWRDKRPPCGFPRPRTPCPLLNVAGTSS